MVKNPFTEYELECYKNQFIPNPSFRDEFKSSDVLWRLQNDFTKRLFNVDKWYNCDDIQKRELRLFMDKYIYEIVEIRDEDIHFKDE